MEKPGANRKQDFRAVLHGARDVRLVPDALAEGRQPQEAHAERVHDRPRAAHGPERIEAERREARPPLALEALAEELGRQDERAAGRALREYAADVQDVVEEVL